MLKFMILSTIAIVSILQTEREATAQQTQVRPRPLAEATGISCMADADGRICRPARGVFVWCRTPGELKTIEAEALADPQNQDRAIQAQILRSSCRTSSAVVVDQAGDPVRVVDYEDVRQPEVSTAVYASINFFAACRDGQYCAVRPYLTAWACPNPADIERQETQKTNAGCLKFASGEAQITNVTSQTGNALLELSVGEGGRTRVYARRIDFRAAELEPPPRNRYRDWCKVGEWCDTLMPALFCKDPTSLERILATAPGRYRQEVVAAEKGCLTLNPTNPLKPRTGAEQGTHIVQVSHPGLGLGFSVSDAFGAVRDRPPTIETSSVSDLVLQWSKMAPYRAITVQGQGTSQAGVIFAYSERDAIAFCQELSDGDAKQFSACQKGHSSASTSRIIARADCPSKVLLFGDKIFKLTNRPAEDAGKASANFKNLIWRNVASDEFVSTTTSDGEATIDSVFDALCPLANPDAAKGIVYRDPKATFPRELRGLWVMNKQVCEIYRRNPADTDGQGLMTIGDREVASYEAKERLNQIRRNGKNWEADISWEAEDEAGQNTVTSAGLEVRSMNGTSRWMRCPRQ